MIPIYPMVNKDLTFIHLGNETKVDYLGKKANDEGLINFEKLRMVAKEVRSLMNMCSGKNYLNNYFDFHVCLSFRPSVRPSGSVRAVPSAKKLTSIPASVSQNVTNKSCLARVKSEKYASLVTLRPQ